MTADYKLDLYVIGSSWWRHFRCRRPICGPSFTTTALYFTVLAQCTSITDGHRSRCNRGKTSPEWDRRWIVSVITPIFTSGNYQRVMSNLAIKLWQQEPLVHSMANLPVAIISYNNNNINNNTYDNVYSAVIMHSAWREFTRVQWLGWGTTAAANLRSS